MNRAERQPPSPQLAANYALHAGVITMIGWYSRGIKYGKRATEIAAGLQDKWGLGQAHNMLGVGLYAAARYEESVEHLKQAWEFLKQSGDQWELNIATFHLGCSYYRMGQIEKAVELASLTFDASRHIGDSRTHCSLFLWSRAVEGQLPFSELDGCFSLASEEIMPTANFMIGKACWQMFNGNTEEAVEILAEAWKLSKKNVQVTYHTISSLTWQVTALRRHADSLEAVDQQQSRQVRKRAWKMAKRAAWWTRFFPVDYPHALRELSILAAARGRTRKALRLARKSCRVAERQKAAFEHAQSLLVRGELAQQLGRSDAAESIETANSQLASFRSQMKIAAEKFAGARAGS